MYVLYHPRSRPGGRIITAALGCEGGITLRGRTPELLIRWGSQRSVNHEIPEVLNQARALSTASDKYRAFQTMYAADVPVPPFGFANDAADWQAQGRTVIGRTRHGYGGEGIFLYEPGQEVSEDHELYVLFIPSVREFRLHVVGDEVIRAQQKRATDTDHPIKNHKNGYRFVGVVGRQLHSNRTEAAVNAVRSLGLDFGAVDMLIGEDDQPYVLEVNTAPACSPLTASVYAEALKRLAERRLGG